jgi:hypothetical protein
LLALFLSDSKSNRIIENNLKNTKKWKKNKNYLKSTENILMVIFVVCSLGIDKKMWCLLSASYTPPPPQQTHKYNTLYKFVYKFLKEKSQHFLV